MKIVADANITYLDETFARHAPLRRVDGRNMQPSDLKGADILLVRSVTKVNESLLRDSAIRFVGTTTIGTDHLDIGWLNTNHVHWESAPGCNADAAAQYSLAMLFLACERLNRDPKTQCVGIFGYGNVGSRLHKLLSAMGVTVVACDPPLSDQGVRGLVSREEALSQDIVSIHVPLTMTGIYPTLRMFDSRTLSRLNTGALLINSSRGNVVDGDSLKLELQSGRLHAALDVWPGEPNIDRRLLELTVVATPHVAGYSHQGRRKGTEIIYDSFLNWAGLANLGSSDPEIEVSGLSLEVIPLIPQESLSKTIQQLTRIAEDDHSMRRLITMDEPNRAMAFDQIRKDYQFRNDFCAYRILDAPPIVKRQLLQLGFS